MIARKTILPMANVAIGAVLGLMALHLVNVYMRKEVYGELQFALAWMGILYIFVDLAMDQAHVKRVSEGMDPGDCFQTYAIFRLFAGMVFLGIAALSVVAWTLVLRRTIEDTTVLALVFSAFYYVTKGAQSVSQSTFDAQLQTARSQLGGLIETLTRVGLTVLFAALFVGSIPYVGAIEIHGPLSAWVHAQPAAALAFAYFVASLVAAIVMVAYLRRSVPKGRFRWEILRSYFAFSLPLFLPTMAGLIGFFIDRVMLGFFGNSLDTAGFSGPRQIVGVLEGLAAGVGILLFPAISSLVASGERGAVPSIVDRSLRYLIVLTLPIIAFLAAFPFPVIKLGLNGDQYADDTLVLTLLAVWSFFLVASRPHYNLLLGNGHTKAAARVGIVQSLLLIALNLVLIPDDIRSLHVRLFGLKALGAALATLLSGIVGYVMLRYYAWKLEGYRQRVALWKHFAAALFMVGVLFPLSRAWPAFDVGRAYAVVALALLGMLAFLGALTFLRELGREDLTFARGTLDPRAMMRYLRSELLRRDE